MRAGGPWKELELLSFLGGAKSRKMPSSLRLSGTSSSGSMARRNPLKSLTRRTLATFIGINVIIAVCVTLAITTTARDYPLLKPLIPLLFVLGEWCLFQTLTDNSLRAYDSLLILTKEGYDVCKKCSQPRPPRTHHCSTCGRCIPRMSHHCGVLGICLGAHNRKAFVLLLFYGTVAAGILLVTCGPKAVRVFFGLVRGNIRLSWGVVIWLQSVYFQFCLTIALGLIWGYHMYLIGVGRTQLDLCTGAASTRDICPPWRRVTGEFDLGMMKNFVDVLDSGVMGFLPVVDIEKIVRVDKQLHCDV